MPDVGPVHGLTDPLLQFLVASGIIRLEIDSDAVTVGPLFRFVTVYIVPATVRKSVLGTGCIKHTRHV